MIEFSYVAKNASGEILEGKIEASNEKGAVDILHSKSYTVISLTLIKKGIFSVDIQRFIYKPKNKDIVVFTRQLATLVDADMPILESLKTLSSQTEKPVFKEIIDSITKYVESGSSLSESLTNYPNLFSPFYINLVKSGETSGKLHDSLIYLANYLEKNQELTSKIKGALTYPAFIVVAMIIVTFIMTVWVLPNLLSIFEEVSSTTDLPLTTKLLIKITGFINKYYYIIIALAIAGPGYLYYYIKTPNGRNWFDNFIVNMPYFGKVIRSFYLSRISESLSTLIKSGIPILDSFDITAKIVGNNNYKKIILEAEEAVRQGRSIGESLKNHEEIPSLFFSMVTIGETSGKLFNMLEHVSKFYKSESENTVQNLSQLLEPVMVFILGLGVAILVSSILLPMYNLVGVI